MIDFTSGYIQRALHELPSQGSKPPWRLYQNYVRDLSMLRYGRLEDDVIKCCRPGETGGERAGQTLTGKPNDPLVVD